MRIEKDFEELLESFNKHKVRYCIVGAFAFGFHAKPRYSKDLDILVDPSVENAENILTALKDFGFSSLNLSIEDFNKEGKFVQLGYEPVRVDIITSIPGCTFSEIWKNKKVGPYGKSKVFFIGLDELIKNKKTVGRKQDISDLEILQKIAKKRS